MSELTTLSNVKEYLRIKNNSDDLLLTRLIVSCSSLIETFISRKIGVTTYTETFSGNNSSYFVFRNYPVISVESVGVNNITSTTDLNFDENLFYGYFPRGARNCSITYTAGYEVTPSDIEQACIELVAFKYKNIEHIDKSSVAMAGETTSFITGAMPDSVKNLLNHYRKVTLN